MLEVGQMAPDFTLPDQYGNERSLAEFRGQKVVLYFYSKDMTSGCTAQACSFGELYPQFREKNSVVIGVSKDTVAAHRKFMDKYGLPFILLSDENKEVLSLYEVWREKNMYGKKVMGTVRSTFLIDEEGRIARIMRKVDARSNPLETLEVL